jgi:hypothetical protein
MNQARLVRAFSFVALVPLTIAWEILRHPNIAQGSMRSGGGENMLRWPHL